MMDQALKKLKEVWGYDSLRKGQDLAVASILQGNDTLVVLPTGGGKSICFQLPALVMDGLCLVISPLIALMQDQVQQLKGRGIRAAALTSHQSRNEIEQILLNARNGMYKLLYLSPERLQSNLFQHYLADLNLSFIAIDEAHCISEWGHEFRPSYRLIPEALPTNVQMAAVTATATPEVQTDISSVLNMKQVKLITGDFVRPNLKWWAKKTQRPIDLCLKAATKTKDSGLIFCDTRKKTHFLAEKLAEKGIKAEAYHGGLEKDDRKAIQARWIGNQTQIVSCTNAFGMGIDKPDCRFVLHAHLPESLEAYYQEAGRAGRDGQLATPALYFSESDYKEKQQRIKQTLSPKQQLLQLYNVLYDAMDVGVGDGIQHDSAFKMYIKDLQKRSGFNDFEIRRGVKNLEDLGLFMLDSELSEVLSRIRLLPSQHKAAKDTSKLQFLEKLKRLLPSLRDEQGFISLLSLSDALQLRFAVLHRALKVLQEEGYIEYERLEQILNIKAVEVRSAKPAMAYHKLEKMLDSKLKRLEWVYLYATSRNCRSVFIARYFGQSVQPCGVCDNCQRKINNKKEGEITEQIYQQIPAGQSSVEEFLAKYTHKQVFKVKQALKKLQDEGLIQQKDGQLIKG